jgi:hypothetical protein
MTGEGVQCAGVRGCELRIRKGKGPINNSDGRDSQTRRTGQAFLRRFSMYLSIGHGGEEERERR